MTTITVTASNPRPSTCLDLAGALDVDVTVGIPGEVIHICDECSSYVNADGERYCEHVSAEIISVLARPPTTIDGEVTLAPQRYDGQLAAYGTSPHQWISGDLLRALRRLDDVDFREACQELVTAAVEACS